MLEDRFSHLARHNRTQLPATNGEEVRDKSHSEAEAEDRVVEKWLSETGNNKSHTSAVKRNPGVSGMSLPDQQRTHKKLQEAHPYYLSEPKVRILKRTAEEKERHDQQRINQHKERVKRGPEKTYEERVAEYEARRAELGIT